VTSEGERIFTIACGAAIVIGLAVAHSVMIALN
jgi:hypothetical protein